jgi:acetyl-CoA hydrolase
LSNVEVVQVLPITSADYLAPGMEQHLRFNTLFICPAMRAAVNEGRVDFTPIFLSEIPDLCRYQLNIDTALIHVSPPDEEGFCSFGLEVAVSKPAALAARRIIAEVNQQMPHTLGDSLIHVSQLDRIVEVDYSPPELPMGTGDPIELQIGRHIAGLIEDGATLQMGIGGIPDGVLHALKTSGVRDLGIHTEMFSDGVIDLVEMGIITNARKTLHPGKMVAGFMLGTQRLHKFVDHNSMIEMHPIDYINDPFVIAQNEKMVAINAAIEVDLTGQVCADSFGHSFYSGVGGQVDFVRGAARSKGGKPIITLPSTARGGTCSRIVDALKPGAGVVTSRNDVHYVATEYGVAYLHGKTIRQRAQALIDIADPRFRDSLTARAQELHYL